MPNPNAQTTILVVDDNESTRYILSRTLRQVGYTVIEASDGETALRLAQEKPDLITLDIHLPDMSGIDVCKRIKEMSELRAIPVIHISATFVQSKDKANALNSGADGYLTHPVEDIVLIATVSAFIRAKQAEKERELLLVQSRKDLEELQMERDLREQFVATLTHDLRTPMTAAKISAQLILKQSDASEEVQNLASRVKGNLDRMEHMIRDLLDANLIRAGEKLPLQVQSCDLRAIIDRTLDNLASTHGDRFILHSPLKVTGSWDCDAVERVIENLAGNALKYGAPYRPITVTISDTPQKVELSVHNEGNPLSEVEQAELFMPYRRTASAQMSRQRGWGLGLTLVRGTVEAHGGVVSVESSEGTGTIFTVVLPRVEAVSA